MVIDVHVPTPTQHLNRDMAAVEFLSAFAVTCVCVATIGVGTVAAFVSWLLSSKTSATDRLVVMWLVYNSLTHFILVSGSTSEARV